MQGIAVKTTVSVVKCSDYQPQNVMKAVKEAVDLLGGMKKFVQPNNRVLIKPNLLSSRPPESAIDTHPAVIEAVTRLAIEAGGSCRIGDSPATGVDTPEAYNRLLKITGMQDVIDRTDAESVRFDDTGSEREVPDAQAFRRIMLTDAIFDADFMINVPKLKTHALTLITGAIKNLYGCVPGSRKIEFHLQAGDNPEMFAQILLNILKVVHPGLSIIDGIIGMDGQGPNAGRRRTFGLIIAGTDPVAIDTVLCRIVGIDPAIVPMLRMASEQGIGVADLSEIQVVGVQPEEVLISDFQLPPQADILNRLPKPLHLMLRNHMVASPTFLREKCTGCGACAKACPVHAINGRGKNLSYDYSTCIRCYCCQEVCPQEAIYLQTSRFRSALETAIAAQWKVKHYVKNAIRHLKSTS